MRISSPVSLCLASALVLGVADAAIALPGQTTRQVKAWIQGHATLRPGVGETLVVTKSDTAARRFTFQASPLSPGTISLKVDQGIIKTETFSIYDKVNGVSFNRLEEALRVIYNTAVQQDYRQARAVLTYPQNPRQTGNELRGEVRVGNLYGYWMEQVVNPDGSVHNGKFQVFLKEDLDTIVTNLARSRS